MLNKFSIIKTDKSDIDLVKPLWEKLNQLHHNLSPDFKDRFMHKTWNSRKKELLEKSCDILINYAVENTTKEIIGYCISTIDKTDKTIGEIDSIYIEELFRKSGVGKEMMNLAIQWLTEKGTVIQKLLVATGNEDVI